MKRSERRLLTTHAGSLPRPPKLAALLAARAQGESVDDAAFGELCDEATEALVARQLEAGIDVVNNGEVGRESFFTYLQHRMTGFGGRSERKAMGDLLRYPAYREELNRLRRDREKVDLLAAPQAIGPVRYASSLPIETECRQLANALARHEGRYTEAFVSSPSPGIVAAAMQNAYYENRESYVAALADALRTEYRAIVDAGFVLQIDAPDLALERHTLFQDRPLEEFLAFVRLVVGAINHALDDIPAEKVRLHVCWGNYEGAHDLDVPLADIWPHVAEAKVGAYLLSMANPRHCHEYRVFSDQDLPPNALIVPGVIDTTTNYVEHPEAVADRLLRIADAVGDPTRIIAGTDCGFETAVGTSMVVHDIAWAKLESLAEGARIASRSLLGS